MEEYYNDVPSTSSPNMTRVSPTDTISPSLLTNTRSTEPVYATIQPKSSRLSASDVPLQTAPVITDTTQLRQQYLEGMISRLTKEKAAMEEEFGRQRKKFMNQMVQAEGESKLMQQSLMRHVQQIESLNKALLDKEEQMTSHRKSTQLRLQEKFDAERTTYEQEIGSLKQWIQKSSHEHQAIVQKMSLDQSQYKKTIEQLKSELNQQQHATPNRLEVESAIGSTKKSRSKSPLHSGQRSPVNEMDLPSENSLEASMIEAAKQTEHLKSVILPYEEEIDLLKLKLASAEERLQLYEGRNPGDVPSSMRIPSPRPTRSNDRDTTTPDISENEKLEVLLNQEKAARHDLEMHIEVLKDQNKFFVEEIDKLKDELTTGKKELEVERDNLKEMKLVLEQTNIRFLKTQDELSREIHSMKNKRNTGDVQSDEQDDDIESGSLQLHSLSQTRSNSAGMGTGPVSGVPPRRRAASWSEGRKLINDENELNVWKSMVEQLQRLLSEQHYELQNMKGTLSSYENQLERTQGQLMQEIDGKDTEIFKMREEVKKIQAALLRERKTREDLQRALVQNKEDMKIKVEGFQANERRLKQKHKTFKDKFTETKHDIQKQLATFTEERSRLQGIADQNQEEYQCLKDLQTNEKMLYESKIKKLSQEKVDAEVNLALTMEELTKLRDAFAERESILTTEIEELKRLLSVSHHESSSFQEQLTASISETEEIKKINSQLERERFDAILSRSNLQEKSKDFIETQQREITQLRREKDEYKQLNDHLKVQLSQLKSQLDDNEQAQKEFMELSQSLQVRLIEMEDEAERNSLNRSMDGSSLNRSMDGSSTEGTSQH